MTETRPELRAPRPGELLRAATYSEGSAAARQSRPWAQQHAAQQSRRALALSDEQRAAIERAREEIEQAKQDLSAASDLLDAIGAADGPDGVAQAIAAYLTVGLDQIGAGDGPADPAVLDILYQDIIVSRLLVAEKIITGELLADGAVTARTLNVVHTDPTTGYGIQLTPEGLTILGPEGTPVVSLRTDGSVVLAVLDSSGAVVGGIDTAGGVVGSTVSANEGLEYKGTELQTLLDALPRGVIAQSRNDAEAVVGANQSRLLQVSFRTPAVNRQMRISIRVHTSNGAGRMIYRVRQSTGTSTTENNTPISSFQSPAREANESSSELFELVGHGNSFDWPLDATITLGVWVQCQDSGRTGSFDPTNGQEIIVEDVGPAVPLVYHTPYVPSGGGGTGGGTPVVVEKREYTKTFNSTWVQSFAGGQGGGRYAYNPPAQTRGYTGYWSSANGVLSAMWGFDRAAIMAFCAGADMVSARLRLKNDHSGNNGATTIELWNARADSRPNNESGRARIGSPSFSPGQTRWLGVSQAMPELKNGDTSAFRINPPSWRASTVDYGYFNGTAALEITVKK